MPHLRCFPLGTVDALDGAADAIFAETLLADQERHQACRLKEPIHMVSCAKYRNIP